MDISDNREARAGTSIRDVRMEEGPWDTIQVEKGKVPIEENRSIFEEGTSSGALNLPYGSDDDEEGYIYVPLELL